MKSFPIRKILLVVMILSLPISAIAQEGEEKETKTTSEEKAAKAPVVQEIIVVTATRGEREIREVPLSTTILSREEIETTPALMIDDVIRSVPGLSLPPTSILIHFPTHSRGAIRGLPGYSALVMIDGVPIMDPYQGFVQWNKVILDQIDQVEIVRGANASLFGNYSTGGTIQLLTKPVTSSAFRFRALAGTDATFKSTASVDRALSDRTGFSLTGDVVDTDGYIRAIPEVRGTIDIPNWYRSRNIQGRIDHRGTSFFRTSIKAGHFTDERSQGTPDSYNATEIFDFALAGHRAIGNDGSLSLIGYLQHENLRVRLTSLNGARDQETLAQDDNLDADGYGGSIQWTRSLSARLPFLTIGVDLQASKGSEVSDNFRGPTPRSTASGGKREVAGFFAQASWRPSSRVEVLSSARLDYFRNHSGFGIDAVGDLTNYEAHSSTEIDPRLSFRYELSDDTMIRASVYRAFSAPEIRDLYRTPGGGRGRQLLPNPLLEPEITTGADIGFVSSHGRARGEINLFWNRTTDTINQLTLELQPILILKPVNIGESRARGVEMIGSINPGRNWRLSGGYTYTNGEIVDNPTDRSVEGNQVPTIPEHSLQASLRYRADNGCSAELRGRYQSETFIAADNQLQLDAFTVVDLSTNYIVNDRLSVFLMGLNLFDERYLAEITVDPRLGEPRQILAGLRWNQAF